MPRTTGSLLRGALCLALIAMPPPAPRAEGPAIDQALDQLLRVDPAALLARVEALRAEAAAQAEEAARLRAEADRMEAEAEAQAARLETLTAGAEALARALGLAAPPPAPMAMAAEEAAPDPDQADPMTNFQDHVLPIFRAHCASCHNPDRRRGGLAVTTAALVLEGGGSGAVVVPGDPDGSRLLRLVTHAEEPVMPPSGDPIPAEEIEVIRRWIADGAPANASAKRMAKAAPDDPAGGGAIHVAATFADTPPLPEAALPAASPLPGRAAVARAVDTSPRAPLLAVGGKREVHLYHTETRALLGALPFPEGDVYTLAFSVNGELLAVGGGEEGQAGLCAVYEIRTGARVGAYGDYYDTVLAADISPDHRMIALGGPNRRVRVYAADDGRPLYTLDAHTDWIQALKFTPDGEVLATADRAGGLYLWQAANGRPVEQLRGHEGAIHALAYTPDSVHLASAGQDGTVQIWDTWKYSRVRSFKAHDAAVLGLDIGPDSRLVTVGADRRTRVWTLEGKEEQKLEDLPDWGYRAHFTADATLVAIGTWDGAITLWQPATGEIVAALSTHPAPPDQG